MSLIAALSTVCHWPLGDYMSMKVSDLLEWERVVTEMQADERRRAGK